MKHAIALGLAFAVTSVAAGAQTTTPAGAAGQQQGWQQFRAVMQQTHMQTRATILSALTPAHRTLVANVIGQLAIAPNPNVQAAVQQIDAALSPGERQAVINAAASAHQQIRSMAERQHAADAAAMTPEERAQDAQRQARDAQEHSAMREPNAMQSDAGAIILRTLTMVGPMAGHGRM